MAKQSPAILEEFSADSNTLFVAFGSLRLEKDIPPFEYRNTLLDLPVKKILIRDLRKIFYHRGLPEICSDLDGIGDFLQDVCRRESIDRVVVFGGSAGGYAALLIGWMLKAHVVHAFAPITLLPSRRGTELLRLLQGRNFRLFNAQLKLMFDPRLSRNYYDLKRVLANGNGQTQYNIYYGKNHKRDIFRCERMSNLPGIRLLGYECSSHHVDHFLQETGEWSRIFQEAINGSS
jgi:hypothetical protein